MVLFLKWREIEEVPIWGRMPRVLFWPYGMKQLLDIRRGDIQQTVALRGLKLSGKGGTRDVKLGAGHRGSI